jgi:hypothetical protein
MNQDQRDQQAVLQAVQAVEGLQNVQVERSIAANQVTLVASASAVDQNRLQELVEWALFELTTIEGWAAQVDKVFQNGEMFTVINIAWGPRSDD